MHLADQKHSLRQNITERLSALSPNERHAESRSVCRRVLENLPPAPLTVTAYFPLTDEVDIRPLLAEFLKRGDAVYLPCGDGRTFVFRKFESLADLHPDGLHIPAPPPTAPLLDPQTLDIALVPGRAFDRKGNRLGRGNGGFDIWIESQRKAKPSTQYWGVALECQIVNAIPMEPHDKGVDAVVTARGIIKSNP